MKTRHLIVIVAILLLPSTAKADGFKLNLEANKIVGKNTEGITQDYLFGHNFDLTNNVDGTYESSHGSVDANDPGSGFNFPAGGPNDSFTYNIQGLWTYTGGVAVPAGDGMILDLLKASNGAPLAQISGPAATPESFSIAATSTHELIWSVSQTSTADVWGLAFTMTGISTASGLPYDESEPLVVVQWTPDFQGDTEAVMQAIYAAATSLPGDYNHDGVVNVADYPVWRDTLGDTDSFQVWRNNFGEGLGGAGSTAVPEPPALLLALIAFAALACDALMRVSQKLAYLVTPSEGADSVMIHNPLP